MKYDALIESLREHELKMIEDAGFSQIVKTDPIFISILKLRKKLQAQ